jgi:hypothetical protein
MRQPGIWGATFYTGSNFCTLEIGVPRAIHPLGGIQSATFLVQRAREKRRSGTQKTLSGCAALCDFLRAQRRQEKQTEKLAHDCRPARTFCTNSRLTPQQRLEKGFSLIATSPAPFK